METEAKIITEIYNRNADAIYRICFMYTKNKHDAEDMVQNVFIRLMKSKISFESPEHEKAWLIRVASNMCKDFFKSAWANVLRLAGGENSVLNKTYVSGIEEMDETLTRVLNLPEKYKISIYLHYYEGYKSSEIARILKKSESTVRTYLMKGRQLLKKEIELENRRGNEYEHKKHSKTKTNF